MKSRHKIHNLAHGIKIQEYNNGSYAYWIEDSSYWRNIPAELGKVLVKALRKKQTIEDYEEHSVRGPEAYMEQYEDDK